MNYAKIDPTITAWARKHLFTIYTYYRDSEVRSIDIVSPQGHKYQLWIDPPTNATVAIHVWNYKRRRKDWSVRIDELVQILEEAHQTIKSWMSEEK